ncbi:zinc finger protein 665-like [Pieris napi]|uniref:zinc finger protein 665-like n=1 Tax=Pieris napi TaxID=78633 RepID=UPI001FB965D5|nr:zinc finger protein 665-like [Pieris napi]
MSDSREDDFAEDLQPNIEMEIKKEINIQIKLEEDVDEANDNPFQNIQVEVKEEMPSEQDLHKSNKDLEIEGQERDVEVKEESEDIVSYDFPNFDDSMDSEEATALGNVETCLQEDMKEECYHQFENPDNYSDSIKEEPDVPVTETHLISNKLISTTSTITNPHVGIIQAETTKTLVMEIHPVMPEDSYNKLGNPEEILPTSYENDDIDYSEPFQLNSITGNILSLEQEAYGLLKAKKQKVNSEKIYTCEKCDKAYDRPYALKKHLQVHQTIENYERGKKMRIITRIKNSEGHGKKKKSLKKVINLKNINKMKARQERVDKRRMNLTTLEEQKTLQADDTDTKIVDINIESKKEGYECTCGQVFQRRSRMETCFRSHDIDDEARSFYSCISCSKQFHDKEELASHRRRLHRKRFPCKFCPTDYHTRKDLFKHLRIHQKVQLMEYKVISEVMNGNQKLRCFMCEQSYSELTGLKSHVMEDHKEPYICPKCNETFPKIIDFAQHTKTDHPEVEGQSVLDVLEAFSKLVMAWKCEECEVQFHEADKLAKHQVEMHSPDLNAEIRFQCDDCRRVFVSQKGLTSHRRIHHNTGSTEEPETIDGVICVECRKICRDEAALASHMRLHSPDRKYPCKFCDFRFATPEKRKIHAELHTGDMKYVCFICEYQCTSENRLRLHKMSEKHGNMKEYLLSGRAMAESKKNDDESDSSNDDGIVCDICGEKFTNTKVMLKHKETHPFIEFPNDDTPTRIFFK